MQQAIDNPDMRRTTIGVAMGLTAIGIINSRRLGHLTGVAAGVLVATYITLEAPLSGMSMNPARTFASAAPGGPWSAVWVHFTAPALGMLLAVELYSAFSRRKLRMCAKLDHSHSKRCIHCGYEPRHQ